MTTLAWGSATDKGRVRDINQDEVLATEGVFVVADGMGGHLGGEVASSIAVEEMAKTTTADSVDELIEAVQQANHKVLDRAREDPALNGMGTTLIALVAMTVADVERLCVANVGDSRLYLCAGDEMMQLTNDHSLVGAMVRDGWISEEEALVHPQRNVVTRALGVEEVLLVDSLELVPVVGDRYLLCSDGLSNELSDAEIKKILGGTEDPQDAASLLVESACAAGGRDNVTVVVVDVVDAEPTGSSPPADRVVATNGALPESEETGESTHGGTAYDQSAEPTEAADSASTELDSLPWRSFVDWRWFENSPLRWFAAVALVVLILLLVLSAVL